MDLFYPSVGFHFSVIFELFPQLPNDFRFQSVSGLSANVETEQLKEGGENRFSHQLPSRTNYDKLVLKRGMFIGSFIIQWCREAIEDLNFAPTNIIITLLNEMHLPVAAWYVVNAFPVKWSISDFNAQESSVVVETLEFEYNYFKTIRV
ncbi:MAG: phage tail protein [Thermodesulfobacteriota bacterium]|nr:phage tail protein [Thermodesulfobacteriota bacterium]